MTTIDEAKKMAAEAKAKESNDQFMKTCKSRLFHLHLKTITRSAWHCVSTMQPKQFRLDTHLKVGMVKSMLMDAFVSPTQ